MGSTTAFGLIALVLIAGCTLPIDQPTKQERPVRLQLNNSIDSTPTFEVSVVERPANITVRYHDERVGHSSITEGILVAESGENQTYKTVELPESAQLHGRYTLEPGESKQTAIDDLPVNFAVVVVVSRAPNEVVSYVTANCDDLNLAALRVTRTSDGVSVTHSCQ
jgi:hypothetical protein